MYNLFRYCLGTFYGSVHFQLLTGIKLGYEREPFWPIFLAITLLLSGVAFLSVNLKKMKERYRDLKFLQKINININIKVSRRFYTLHIEGRKNRVCSSGFDIQCLRQILFRYKTTQSGDSSLN